MTDLFPKGDHRVFNIPSGAPFLTVLAENLVESLGDALPTALVLLPTRRAVRELGNAFVKISDGKGASLLPRMRPLADIDPEEPPFEPGELAHQVKPAISATRRRFELARLVREKEARLTGVAPDAAGALALTDPLIALLDDAAMEDVSRADLSKLDAVVERVSAHYQSAAVFYEIVQTWWPEYLEANGVLDPMARRVALLRALREHWDAEPPDHPIVIAGSTGTLNASAELMALVARMPRGCVVLPGLAEHLDEAAWTQVNAQHPQNSLKRLIETIGISRADVRQLSDDRGNVRIARRRLISEALIPVAETADWPARIEKLKASMTDTDVIGQAVQGLSLIEARTDDEEAATIALIFRHTLDDPEATAALITPDPALARRVRAKLARWSVRVDSSAGEPLEETPVGVFLSLLTRLAQDPTDPVTLAAVFKHPLIGLGLPKGEVRAAFERFERHHLRGPRPATLEDLYAKSAEAISGHIRHFMAALEPLMKAAPEMPDYARVHITVAETVASTDTQDGASRLWRGEAGEKAAVMLADLVEYGASLPGGDVADYHVLVSNLMRGKVVRPRAGTHPRLFILGPLEARLLNFDTLILGGLNEGVWPAAPDINPFMSRGMRKALGLSAPERRFGLSAHDFAELASHKRVFLTRSVKTSEGPTVASRWLWRLQTLLTGALGDSSPALAPDVDYRGMAHTLDTRFAGSVDSAPRPTPAPPYEARWGFGRSLGVTTLSKLIRDPYSIYASKILGIQSLDSLDQSIGARERGSAIHKAVESFFKNYTPVNFEADLDWLTDKLTAEVARAGFAPENLPQERVRLSDIAEQFLTYRADRIADGWDQIGAELNGVLDVPIEGGDPFRITAWVDRIEQRGTDFAVFDYKTGSAPTKKVINASFDVQLPLTAKIIEHEGVGKLRSGTVTEHGYYMMKANGKSKADFIGKTEDEVDTQASDALAVLQKLIAYFDNPENPYRSQPRAQFQNPYGDYDHLARRGEWGQLGSDTAGQGPS